MSLNVVDMCVRAQKSAFLFGEEVELHGLSNESMNRKRGVAKGFVEETNRRAVFIYDRRACVSIKPENIHLVDEQSDFLISDHVKAVRCAIHVALWC